MSTHQQLNDTTVKNSSKVIWFGIQASVPMFIAAILILEYMVQFEPIMPEFKNIFIGLTAVTIPTPFFLLNLFKRKQLELRDNIQLGMENTTKELQRYLFLLVIGLSLCNLSAAFGLVLYVITGLVELSIFFICVSLLLGFLYKPSLK